MNDANLNTARILILDDDVSHVCLLMNFLDRLGYRNLKSLTDSRKVFDELKEFQPDIILLDLNMPNLNGFEVLDGIKALIPEDAFIPVLVMTGDASPFNEIRYAFQAIERPPKSPMFSPTVSAPLTCNSGVNFGESASY